jgi:hypothetical protein
MCTYVGMCVLVCWWWVGGPHFDAVRGVEAVQLVQQLEHRALHLAVAVFAFACLDVGVLVVGGGGAGAV